MNSMPFLVDDMAGEDTSEKDPLGGGLHGEIHASPGQEGFVVNNGWIKIHRKITEWEWYQDDNTFRVFFHILMMTNHEEKKWHGITIKRGQFLTGRLKLAEDLKMSEQSIRTALNKLKSTNEITISPTTKYSIITVLKWNEYQKKTDKTTNEQPTTNQQLTTTKKLKNEKNVRSKEKTAPEAVAYSFDDELNKLLGTAREDLRIIGMWIDCTKLRPENHAQMQSILKRNLRTASLLKGYSEEDIRYTISALRGIDYLKKFTLETVAKYIDEMMQKRKKAGPKISRWEFVNGAMRPIYA